jgi:hypothetical protein
MFDSGGRGIAGRVTAWTIIRLFPVGWLGSLHHCECSGFGKTGGCEPSVATTAIIELGIVL